MLNCWRLERETLRTGIKKIFTDALTSSGGTKDENTVEIWKITIDDKAKRIFDLDGNIKEMLMSEEPLNEEEFVKELTEQEKLREEIIKFKQEIGFTEVREKSNNLNYPRLELPKFDGNVKNWINFWGQFKKIHEDKKIIPEDKFQYLLQAMQEGSQAKMLVESFPPSASNYFEAIEQLKNRFARDEFLIEVYVRELLDLVLNQQNSDASKSIPLSMLYDKLETQLRALETLGVVRDKYAAMLLPLVESALPIDLIKIWERQRTVLSKSNNDLQGLLEFLKREVEAEERINLIQSGFTFRRGNDSSNRSTLETLHAGSSKFKMRRDNNIICVFCDKGHASQDCIKAQSMSLEQKKGLLIKKKGCFSCLKLNHSFRLCKASLKCIICSKKHHAIMCPELNKERLENNKKDDREEKILSSIATLNSETLLQTLRVEILSGNKVKIIRALLDSGSQRSYITEKCAQEMMFSKEGNENIVQGVFGGKMGTSKILNRYKFTLRALNRSYETDISVLEQPKICNHIPKLRDHKVIEYLKKKKIVLTDLVQNNDHCSEIDLLIQADFLGRILTDKLENINQSIFAVHTQLGWTVMGKQIFNHMSSFITTTLLECTISDLWNLETIGIRDSAESKSKEIDIEVLENFRKTSFQNKGGRYVVNLPWQQDFSNRCLMSNYDLAERRLFSNSKRLMDIGKFSDYENVLFEWIDQGIIEEVVDDDDFDKNVHYLAHHAVVKETSATTKIRPVFDASAKGKNGISLNDLLLKGPNLIELIVPLLIQFRINKIGVTADITKAFLQIALSEKERNYLRFLWWEDYSQRIVKIYRHCRVVFGLKSSPFLLAATLDLHIRKFLQQYPSIADKLLNSFYVDNCVASVRDETELSKFIEESKDILSKAKFELRGWVFNSLDRQNTEDNTGMDNKTISVLGLLWNPRSDVLLCDTSRIEDLDSVPKTKRGLLSMMQRIFDPIGFTTPLTILPKLLLKETWKLKLSWDEILPDDIAKPFINWLDSLKFLNFCQIHRHLLEYESRVPRDTSIHVFVDASKLSYAACVFIRFEFEDRVSIKLLLGKARISPVKIVSLPRLELMAALIGVRLVKVVKNISEFKNTPVQFWSDSTVVLAWIKTNATWKAFVANRVKEIRSESTIDQWNHVPGNKNIADVLSRSCSGQQLVQNRWWEGPDWLKRGASEWPNAKTENINWSDDVLIEQNLEVTTVLVQNFTKTFESSPSFQRTLRLIAWILRFYNNCRSLDKNDSIILLNDEIRRAENCLLKLIQTDIATNKFDNLKGFQTFEDRDGILRIKSRLSYGDFPEDFKFPIILPSKHVIVRQLIMQEHVNNSHAGPKILLGILRERFWIFCNVLICYQRRPAKV